MEVPAVRVARTETWYRMKADKEFAQLCVKPRCDLPVNKFWWQAHWSQTRSPSCFTSMHACMQGGASVFKQNYKHVCMQQGASV
jgi:hypothetical protein